MPPTASRGGRTLLLLSLAASALSLLLLGGAIGLSWWGPDPTVALACIALACVVIAATAVCDAGALVELGRLRGGGASAGAPHGTRSAWTGMAVLGSVIGSPTAWPALWTGVAAVILLVPVLLPGGASHSKEVLGALLVLTVVCLPLAGRLVQIIAVLAVRRRQHIVAPTAMPPITTALDPAARRLRALSTSGTVIGIIQTVAASGAPLTLLLLTAGGSAPNTRSMDEWSRLGVIVLSLLVVLGCFLVAGMLTCVVWLIDCRLLLTLGAVLERDQAGKRRRWAAAVATATAIAGTGPCIALVTLAASIAAVLVSSTGAWGRSVFVPGLATALVMLVGAASARIVQLALIGRDRSRGSSRPRG